MGTILIIDDDQLIRKIAGDILSKGYHEVLTAKDPVEGLDILQREEVEVVLLDVVMPVESGFDMIPKIKAINSDITVIIMTAYASMESAIEAIRKGADDFIQKPLHPERLLHSVKNVLEKYALVLENRSLVETLEERIQRLELFEKIFKAISSTLDLEKLLEKIMEIVKSILGAQACSVLLLDENTGELVFTVAIGDNCNEVKEFRIKPGEGIAGWVLEHGKPLLVKDAANDERFFKGAGKKTGFQTKSMIAVPLVVKNKTVGVIEVINKADGGYFAQKDEQIMTTLAGQIAVSIDNAKMTKDLKISRKQIEEYSKNLESMVRKRTEELEKANEELKSAHAQLLQTEKLSSLGQLAAGVAHEINNPIGFINSNLRTMGEYVDGIRGILNVHEEIVKAVRAKDCSLLKERLKELNQTKQKENFEFIMTDIEKLVAESREGTYRVYKIVRDLRDFSRADDAERQFFDIHRAIESTLNIVWNEIKYKAEVIKDYGDIPEVECLPTQLNQVFMNLLVNAAHAIEDKGKITIKTYDSGDRVFFEISDTGSGIPPEIASKIFDPFFTTKEPGKGTGLGLSIVYNIIKNHNGNIRVESRLGEGTTFIIELPIEMGIAEGALVEDAVFEQTV